MVFAETQDPITEKLEQLGRLGRSKVELLLSGAIGAAGEVEGGGRVVGFDEEVLYWPEELIGFFGEASGEKEAQDAGIVIAEVDLLAVRKFDGEEMAEVRAEIFEGRVGSEEDTPAFGPRLVNERVEKSRFLGDAHEIGREVRQLSALRAFVERLIFLFGFEDDFEDAGLAGGIEQDVERLEILGEQILQTRLTCSGSWGLGSWFRRRGGKRNGRSSGRK
jgi:hypothetical protein